MGRCNDCGKLRDYLLEQTRSTLSDSIYLKKKISVIAILKATTFCSYPQRICLKQQQSYGSYIMTCSAMAVLAWIRQSPDGSSQHYKNYVMRQRDYVSILDWEATRSLIHFQGTKHNCLTPHFPFSRLC